MANLIAAQNPHPSIQKTSSDSSRKFSRRQQWAKILILLFANLSLVILGGFLFQFIESNPENSTFQCGVKKVRRDFVDVLWSQSQTDNEWAWKSSARQKLNDLENQLLEAVDKSGVKTFSTGQTTWNLTNTIIYTISLMTTIGWSHLVPSSLEGELVSIGFSMLASPIFFSLVFELVTVFGLFKTQQQQNMSNETCKSNSSLAQPLWGMVAFIGGLAFIYSMIFQWNPWRALYFVAATTFANGNIGDTIPEDPTLFLCLLGFHLVPGFVLFMWYQLSVTAFIRYHLDRLLAYKTQRK